MKKKRRIRKNKHTTEFHPSPLTLKKAAVTREILERKYSNQNISNQGKMRMSEKKKKHHSKRKSCYGELISRRKRITDFETISVIGRGSFAEVRLVREKSSQKVYALKVLRKEDMLERNQVSHVRAERDILALCGSEWIVQLQYSFQDEYFLYFAMEYLPGGDLMFWLEKEEIFSEELVQVYVAQLVLAIESIHRLNYVHRDLKPDNILIDSEGNIKLTDFGLCKPYKPSPSQRKQHKLQRDLIKNEARRIGLEKKNPHHISPSPQTPQYLNLPPSSSSNNSNNSNSKPTKRELMFTMVGSKQYIAPEVFLKEGYDHKADWWSLGVIMFEMVCGYPPFYYDEEEDAYLVEQIMKEQQQKQQKQRELQGREGSPSSPPQSQVDIVILKIVRYKDFLEFPSDVPLHSRTKDLIKRLICKKKKRYGFEDIVQHPFFEGFDWNKVRTMQPKLIPNLKNSDICTDYFNHYKEDEVFMLPNQDDEDDDDDDDDDDLNDDDEKNVVGSSHSPNNTHHNSNKGKKKKKKSSSKLFLRKRNQRHHQQEQEEQKKKKKKKKKKGNNQRRSYKNILEDNNLLFYKFTFNKDDITSNKGKKKHYLSTNEIVSNMSNFVEEENELISEKMKIQKEKQLKKKNRRRSDDNDEDDEEEDETGEEETGEDDDEEEDNEFTSGEENEKFRSGSFINMPPTRKIKDDKEVFMD